MLSGPPFSSERTGWRIVRNNTALYSRSAGSTVSGRSTGSPRTACRRYRRQTRPGVSVRPSPHLPRNVPFGCLGIHSAIAGYQRMTVSFQALDRGVPGKRPVPDRVRAGRDGMNGATIRDYRRVRELVKRGGHLFTVQHNSRRNSRSGQRPLRLSLKNTFAPARSAASQIFITHSNPTY